MRLFIILMILFTSSCGQPTTSAERRHPKDSASHILDISNQRELAKRIGSMSSRALLQDTAAFLFLPLDASCPACRDKTIDSILKYSSKLGDRHFIIISAPNMKTVHSYFDEESITLLSNTKNVILDTTDHAFKADLVLENPVIYYLAKTEVYEKVNCEPASIRKDLKEFFKDL